MKKTLLALIVAGFTCLSGFAQETNIQPIDSLVSVVDSLSTRLDKLQHNFDYLETKYSLDNVLSSLYEQSNNASLYSQRLVTEIYHSHYNHDLYTAYLNNYNASISQFDATKQLVSSVKTNVAIRMIIYDFSEAEKNVLYSSLNSIEKAISRTQSSLDLYKIALDSYYGLR